MVIPPPDKVLHFAVGALCTVAGLSAGVLACRYGASASPLWAGAMVCLIAAVGREAYNQRQGGLFDWRDIAATMAGSVPVLAAFLMGRAS